MRRSGGLVWIVSGMLGLLCMLAACDDDPPPSSEAMCPLSDLPVPNMQKSASACTKMLARGLADLEVDKGCKTAREQAGSPCVGDCTEEGAICHLNSLTDPDKWTYTSVDDDSCQHSGGKKWTASYDGQVSCSCTCL